MGFLDWLIVIIPVGFVVGMAIYSRRYLRGVADFLAAGRVCGRYVISVGDVANALSIIGLVAYVEVHYKTGFALAFWQHLTSPLGVIMGLLGFCTYRFRETKAMSLGQFLEMRYNRTFRIFAAALRSLSEMLANMIMPAVAAIFWGYRYRLSWWS
jgi:SSS family solute:Na+ symporter